MRSCAVVQKNMKIPNNLKHESQGIKLEPSATGAKGAIHEKKGSEPFAPREGMGQRSAARSGIHRNITLKRLMLDFGQAIRCQQPMVRILGRPFARSRRRVEIDITYRCNMRCLNCNRSATQAPAAIDMPVAQIKAFLHDSVAAGIRWERIRLLGGEPTLHPELSAIVTLLETYRCRHNPTLRIVICTNGSGPQVRNALSALSPKIVVKNTLKSDRQRLFRPFNLAPVDQRRHRFADFGCGCRIIEDCGLGLTPQGYYPCAIAGGIDRIFGFGLGRRSLPAVDDEMTDLLERFCPLCGHFGFARPTRKPRISRTWRRGYERYRRRQTRI